MLRWTLLALLALGFTSQRATTADDAKPIALDGHAAGVRAVLFLGAGKMLATGCEDKIVRLVDIAKKEVTVTLRGHEGGIQALSATRDGKVLASSDDNGIVKVWDVETQKELFTLKGQKGDAVGLEFSSDGKTLAVGGGGYDKKFEKAWGEIRFWDATTGKEAGTINWDENRVTGIAFSPDGKTLASCSSNGAVVLWDVATAKKKSDLGKNPNGAHSVAFTSDGKTLACGNFVRELTIKFWDVNTGKETRTIESKENASVLSMKFLPDNKTLAVGGIDSDGLRDVNVRGAYVALWDETGKQTALKGHFRAVFCVSLDRDATRLAASGLDKIVHVWELPKKDK
jgi:WD40 repeat protein